MFLLQHCSTVFCERRKRVWHYILPQVVLHKLYNIDIHLEGGLSRENKWVGLVSSGTFCILQMTVNKKLDQLNFSEFIITIRIIKGELW